MPTTSFLDVSRIDQEKLDSISQNIIRTIRDGALIYWIKIGDNSLGIRALNNDEMQEIVSLYKNYSLEYSNLEWLSRVVVGLDHRIRFFKDSDIERLHEIFIYNGVIKKILKYSSDLQEVFSHIITFIPYFCDTPSSKSLWEWYKFNSVKRKFNGANNLEASWVHLNTILDESINFNNFKFIASLFSKDVKKIETPLEKGFSSYKRNKGGQGVASNEDMEEWIKNESKGIEDEHSKAIRQLHEFRDREIEKERERKKKLRERIEKEGLSNFEAVITYGE